MKLFDKRIAEIMIDNAAKRPETRKRFVEEAIEHFLKQLDIDPTIEPEWTLTTAMYFSGTIFTTIGSFFRSNFRLFSRIR
jgi:hypothetical protein